MYNEQKTAELNRMYMEVSSMLDNLRRGVNQSRGLARLDADGYLPDGIISTAFIDRVNDFSRYETFADFPTSNQRMDHVYLDESTNKLYTFNGYNYVPVSANDQMYMSFLREYFEYGPNSIEPTFLCLNLDFPKFGCVVTNSVNLITEIRDTSIYRQNIEYSEDNILGTQAFEFLLSPSNFYMDIVSDNVLTSYNKNSYKFTVEFIWRVPVDVNRDMFNAHNFMSILYNNSYKFSLSADLYTNKFSMWSVPDTDNSLDYTPVSNYWQATYVTYNQDGDNAFFTLKNYSLSTINAPISLTTTVIQSSLKYFNNPSIDASKLRLRLFNRNDVYNQINFTNTQNMPVEYRSIRVIKDSSMRYEDVIVKYIRASLNS